MTRSLPMLWWPGPQPTPLAAILLVAALGACVGSFLNVVAWRLPRQQSLLLPASHCPRCGSHLAWYDNIPVLSWLLIRGRCRRCQQPVSWRYPLVELACACLWLLLPLARPEAMGAAPPLLPLTLAGWLLLSWLLALTLIDLDHLWLPESLCRWGVLLGLATTAALGFSQGAGTGRALLLSHLLAAGLGLLLLESVSSLGQKLLGRPALGLGDAKLAALLGAWLGPRGLLIALALAVLSGALLGICGRLSGRLRPHQPFPFGPFLALGALLVWMQGHGFWWRLAGWPSAA
jgi:leader peptidase (prepilin peptidase) / N-methyltransferase